MSTHRPQIKEHRTGLQLIKRHQRRQPQRHTPLKRHLNLPEKSHMMVTDIKERQKIQVRVDICENNEKSCFD